jgi:ADP-heptose:LPS heptosyltransferase
MLRIDTHHGWFKGLGDLVCFAWIGASLQAAGHGVEFYAHGWRAEVLRFFQQRVTDDLHEAIMPQEGYETAIRQGAKLNYLEWIAQQCGLGDWSSAICHPSRPRLDLPPMDRELGRAASARVLIFPEGAWPTRTWPRSYFLELCHLLKAAGIGLAVVTVQRVEDFGAFRCIYDQSLAFIAAAIQRAQLVIGNDSGPAHLAGTIGTKTLAIQGPTTERIYAHIPEIVSLRKRVLICAGCHGLPPFRASCALGCHELYRTFPEDVFVEVMHLLGEQIDPELRNSKPRKGGRA